MVSKKMMLGVGAAVLMLSALLGVAVVFYISTGSEGGSGSWQDYRDASSLLAASERIVVATYLDEETHEIPTVTDGDGKAIGSVTEQFLRFRIVEALKGDGTASEMVYVTNTLGYKTAQIGGGSKSYSYDNIDLTANENYVLFLRSRSMIEGYPTKYGDTLWTRPGEPAIAQLDDSGRLRFIATDRYKDTVDDEGLERVSGSDAPFEMTKEDIARSVAER